MRLKSLLAMLFGLLFASALAAQTPEAATPTVAPPPVQPENILNLDLSTGGRVVIQLRPDVAPNHVERIKTLARQGFYDGVIFHRVIEGFMAQTGDPTGTGEGGSELPDLAAEFNLLPHVRGAVSMARAAEENSANSQFFIVFMPRLSLDRDYTVFGRVIEGMEHVDAIARGEPPANPSRIFRASIGADNVPPMTPDDMARANLAIQVEQARQAQNPFGTQPAPAPVPAPVEQAPAEQVEDAPQP